MMLRIFFYLLCFVSLGGCCVAPCDCFNDAASSIFIQFNLDSNSTNGFKRHELLGTTFLCYKNNQSFPDTLGDLDSNDISSKYGNNNIGFQIWNSIEKKVYENPDSFRVYNPQINLDVHFTDIVTKGNIPTALCCNCYSNESITYSVNGKIISEKGKNREGVSYTISKP